MISIQDALILIGRYSQLWDDRRYDDWIELFAENAIFDWRGRVAQGYAEIQRLIGSGNDARPDGPGIHLMTNSVAREFGGSIWVASDFVYLTLSEGRLVPTFAGRTYDRMIDGLRGCRLVFRAVRFLDDETPVVEWPDLLTDKTGHY